MAETTQRATEELDPVALGMAWRALEAARVPDESGDRVGVRICKAVVRAYLAAICRPLPAGPKAESGPSAAELARLRAQVEAQDGRKGVQRWSRLQPAEALSVIDGALAAPTLMAERDYWKGEAETVRSVALDAALAELGKARGAIREALTWHETQRKAMSKQPPSGRDDWMWSEHAEQIEALQAALALLPPAPAEVRA